MDQLTNLEVEEVENMDQDQKERFKINDLETAAWAMRKIRAYNQKIKEIEDLYKSELDRLKKWKESATKTHSNHISFFEAILSEYLMEQRANDPKFRITTPAGSVSTRRQQPKFIIEDQEALINWLLDNGNSDLVRVRKEPQMAELKKIFTNVDNSLVDGNGEIVPGIIIRQQPEKIVIKIDE